MAEHENPGTGPETQPEQGAGDDERARERQAGLDRVFR